MCSRARVLMQSSYEDTVENGAWRERGKKKISPESNQKRRKKENIFDIWSTFSSFSGKKGKNHPFLDRSRDASFFSLSCVVLVLLFVAGKNQPTPENEETRTRGERREKKTLHDTIVVSHNRGTHLRATNSIRNIR